MFFTAASALLVAATSVAAAPGLSLKVSGPAQVNGADSLSVVATIVNTGDETLKLFNDPRGTLSSFETNSFAITSSSGVAPKFVGAKVKYSFDAAAKSNDAKAFTVLAPGQSVDVTHDLAAAYNFNTTGAGAYTIEPSKLFHYVDASGKVNEIYAHVTDAHTTSLTGNLVSSRVQARSLQKRIGYAGCSSTQQSQVSTAASSAETYATNAYNYLVGISAATTRYTTWFGTYTASRKSTVQSHYNNIKTSNPTTYTFDCSTCTDAGTYAYVYPDTFGKVYLCPVFWQVANTGTDSRAGTIVHESSHFTKNGGTDDYVYGQTGAKSLAKSNPDQAIFNADSHEYFAENNPAQS